MALTFHSSLRLRFSPSTQLQSPLSDHQNETGVEFSRFGVHGPAKQRARDGDLPRIRCAKLKSPKEIKLQLPDKEAGPCVINGDASFQKLLGKCKAQALQAEGLPLAFDFDSLVENSNAVYQPIVIPPPKDFVRPITISIYYRVDTPLDAGEKNQLTTHKIKGQASLTELLKGIKMRHLIHERDVLSARRGLSYAAITDIGDLEDGATYYAQDVLTRQVTDLENRTRNRLSGVEVVVLEVLKNELRERGIDVKELPRLIVDKDGEKLFECEGFLETPDDFKVLEVKSVMTKAVAEETLGSVNQKLRWSKAPEMARFREKPCHLVLGAEYIPLDDRLALEKYLALEKLPIFLPNGKNWGIGASYLQSPPLL